MSSLALIVCHPVS